MSSSFNLDLNTFPNVREIVFTFPAGKQVVEMIEEDPELTTLNFVRVLVVGRELAEGRYDYIGGPTATFYLTLAPKDVEVKIAMPVGWHDASTPEALRIRRS